MHTVPRTASLFGIALWWGSLTTLGFIVVPLLFAHLETAQAAGRMAARLFEVQAYVSQACGVLLLALHLRSPAKMAGTPSRTALLALRGCHERLFSS